jgi:hypothetical protein
MPTPPWSRPYQLTVVTWATMSEGHWSCPRALGRRGAVGFDPGPFACKVLLQCRSLSFTWAVATPRSAPIGRLRMLLWSALVVSTSAVSSSRSQVVVRTVSAAACLTWERSSVYQRPLASAAGGGNRYSVGYSGFGCLTMVRHVSREPTVLQAATVHGG